MRLILANEATAARRRVYFHLVDAVDGITAEVGEAAGQPQVSSDGAAWTNTGIGTLTHIGNGRYYADLTQTLVATAGVSIETRYKSAATAECPGDSVQVVAFNPYATDLGLSNVSANVVQISGDSGAADTLESLLDGGGGTLTANITGNLSGSVGSVTGNVGGNVTGSIGSLAAQAKADVNAEVDTALADIRLDEIIQNAASPVTPTINSFWDRITSKDGSQTYDRSTDSLEAVRDALPAAAPSAATIADAVWDEARAGHVAAGSFGEGVASVQGNVTGSVASVTGNVGGNVVGSVGSVTGNVGGNVVGTVASVVGNVGGNVTGNLGGTLSAAALAQINTEADTALSDIRLDELIQNAAAPADPTADSFIDLITSKDAGQTFDRSTDSLEAVRDALAVAGPSAAVIADAVWDELRAGHVGAGSFGEGVASVQGNVTGSVASVTGSVGGNVVGTVASVVGNVGGNVVGNVNGNVVGSVASVTGNVGGNVTGSVGSVAANGITAGSLDPTASQEIADQVWDEALAGHLAAGSTGEALNNAAAGGSAPTAAAIADAVWDEALADHVAAGSMGFNENLIDNVPADTSAAVTTAHGVGSYVEVAAPSVAAIADGVWDELIAGHLGAGSTGEALSNAAAGGAGLTQQQVADALKLAPAAGAPAAGSVYAEIDTIMGAGFNGATDSLEEIRDRVDECCGVGGGGADDINVEGI